MKKVFWYLVLLLFGAGIAIVGKEVLSDPEITFLLTERHNLSVGDVVEFQGIVIGEVIDVGFDQTNVYDRQYKMAVAKIDKEYFSLLYREMDFLLMNSTISTGHNKIEVVGYDLTTHTPLMPGDRVFITTPGERLLEDAEKFIDNIWTRARPMARILKNQVEKGVQQLINKLSTPPPDSIIHVPGYEEPNILSPPVEEEKASSDLSTGASQ